LLTIKALRRQRKAHFPKENCRFGKLKKNIGVARLWGKIVGEIYDLAQKPQTSAVDMTAEKPVDLGNTKLQLREPTDKTHSRKTKARG